MTFQTFKLPLRRCIVFYNLSFKRGKKSFVHSFFYSLLLIYSGTNFYALFSLIVLPYHFII